MQPCPGCGHDNPGDHAFCEECGAVMGGGPGSCPSCGHQNPDDYAFCEECGADLGQDAPAEDAPAEPAVGAPDAAGPALERECAACGGANPGDYAFCQECGEPLAPPVHAAAAEQVPAPAEAEPPRACAACGYRNPADYAYCEDCGESLAPRHAASAPAVAAAAPGPAASRPAAPARGESPDRPPRTPSEKRRRFVPWLAGVVLIAAAGGVIAVWLSQDDEVTEGERRQAATVVADEAIATWFPAYGSASAEVLPTAGAGYRVAYGIDAGEGGVPVPRVLLVDVDLEARTIGFAASNGGRPLADVPSQWDTTIDLVAEGGAVDVQATTDFTYRVYVPPGATLSSFVQSDGRGGCWWFVRLTEDTGGEVESDITSNPPYSSSNTVSLAVPTGVAYAEILQDTGCLDGYDYVTLHLETTGGQPPPTTTTSTSTSTTTSTTSTTSTTTTTMPAATTAPTSPPTTSDVPVTTFWADRTSIGRGECTWLNWETDPPSYYSTLDGPAVRDPDFGGSPIDYDGVQVATGGDRVEVCPDRTATYVLTTSDALGARTEHRVTVSVGSPEVMPPYLVLTHRERLNDHLLSPAADPAATWSVVEGLLDARYGADAYTVLDYGDFSDTDDAADLTNLMAHRDHMMELIEETGRPAYIIIIGGPDVVPFGEFANPCLSADDTDVVYGDTWYGDLDADPLHHPEVPVARVPDGRSLDLIRAVFAATERSAPSGTYPAYTQGHPQRPYVEEVTWNLLEYDQPGIDQLLERLPVMSDPTSPQRDASIVDATWTYFILHGSDKDTSKWWGEAEPGKPASSSPLVAFEVATARSRGLVVSEACYGAWIMDDQTPANSIALAFLRNGAFAFIGSTTMTYSDWPPVEPEPELTVCNRDVLGSVLRTDEECVTFEVNPESPLETGVTKLSGGVFERATSGMHPLDAFHLARQELGQGCFDEKHQNAFVYYGLPPRP